MTESTIDAAESAPGRTFEERQTLPSWFGPTLVALSVPALLIAGAAVFDAEGTTLEAVGFVPLIAVLVLGPIPVLLRSALRTTVSDDGVTFRFRPFHLSDRRISFEEIEEVRRSERRAFQYGLRRTRWDREYRPNAREGDEIHRKAGPPIFLGSDRPHGLRTAIEEGMRRDRTR